MKYFNQGFNVDSAQPGEPNLLEFGCSRTGKNKENNMVTILM
jgi:hypothetical protein